VLFSWSVASEVAAKDRIGTRHKVTFIMPLPKHYIDKIREIPGVKQAGFANWFGGVLPGHEQDFFASLAVEAKTTFDIYDEMLMPPDQKEHWLQDRQGAIVGVSLARKFGWKVGDRVTLTGTIYPGDWVFNIDGIYEAARKTIDQSTLFFHWDYLNEGIPERRRDQIGWVMSRVDDPAHAADIAVAIDKNFEDMDVQTLSMSERAMQTSFLGMFSAIFDVIDGISLVILLIMILILGNTIAMGVRERTSEYATMRAIGFLPRHIAGFVLAEALAIGAAGGVLGLLIAYPMVNRGMGRWIEENMGGFFPYFRVDPKIAAAAIGLALVLAVVAALLPALRASRLDVTEGLRRLA
jgi:putative ABC transport system permease protein